MKLMHWLDKYFEVSLISLGIGEYNKFCVNSIEKKASLLDWC